jgi:hypothetical protein
MRHLPCLFNVRGLVIFLSFFISFICSAQKFSLGVKGGASLSWVGFGDPEAKDIYNRKIKPGYSAGFFINFPLKNNYDLVLEGAYSQKGRRLLFNEDSWENNTTYKFIDMAMLLRKSFKFHLKKNIPVQAFVNIGPEINYWLSADGYLQVGGSLASKYKYNVIFEGDRTQSYPTMYYNDINRWLFSICLGAGFKAPIRKNQHIITEVRFVSGHTFLGKKESTYLGGILEGDGNFQDTQKTNIKSLMLTVGYAFDFDVIESRKGKSTLKKSIKRTR